MSTPDAIRWNEEHLELLDQRILPGTSQYLSYRDPFAVADAIRDMVVRGAPAIGITAAYGMALAAAAQAPQLSDAGTRVRAESALAQ